MSSSCAIWSSSKKPTKENRGYSSFSLSQLNPFSSMRKEDTKPAVLNSQLHKFTPLTVKRTKSTFNFTECLEEIGYIPKQRDSDSFRLKVVHTKVAAYNREHEPFDRSCRELYPKTPIYIQKEIFREEQKQSEEVKRTSPPRPHSSSDGNHMDVEDSGEVVKTSDAIAMDTRENDPKTPPVYMQEKKEVEMERVRSVLSGPENQELLIEKYAIDMTRAKML
eukprot:gene29689-38818_t